MPFCCAGPFLSHEIVSIVMMEKTDIRERLRDAGYIADETLRIALQFAIDLERPLLLEGAAGVGKTEIARALAHVLDTRLIRLQCYEGLDANNAIYEWNYQRQLLAIKTRENEQVSSAAVEEQIFSEAYLLRRPLLEAISQSRPPVLLIDEIDRADEEFEAYLLEILSDFQITIPELGTISAKSKPHVILTSNGTRELSDALRRRCLYTYVDYPTIEQEVEIVLARVPGIDRRLADHAVDFVHALRREDLEKVPGVAETLDWASALVGTKRSNLEDSIEELHATLICLLKTEGDRKAVTREVLSRLLGRAA